MRGKAKSSKTKKALDKAIEAQSFKYTADNLEGLTHLLNEALYANAEQGLKPFRNTKFNPKILNRSKFNTCVALALNQALKTYAFPTLAKLITKLNVINHQDTKYELFRMITQGGCRIPVGAPVIKMNIYGKEQYITLNEYRQAGP